MKLAIAGCGRITEHGYLPAIAGLDGIEVCALADPDRSRRETLAAAGGGPPTFASLEGLLAAGRPDAVVIASPPRCHLEQAELACAAGVPALVEKPPGRDASEARLLAGLEPEVRVGFNRRFSHLAALEPGVPANGDLELSMEISYRRASWRAHDVADDALGDLGPHLVDLAACLLGGGLVSARCASISADRARVELAGSRGSARLLCRTDAPWAERIEVRCPSAGRRSRSVQGGLARGAVARLRRGEHPLVASLRAQLRAFDEAIRGEGGGALAGAGDGLRAMLALDAARASAGAGGAEVAL